MRDMQIESACWQSGWFLAHIPAPKLSGNIVETTGAGDAFIAAALACRTLSERGSGIVEAAELGNLIAGRKCRKGGYGSLWEGSTLERSLGIVATEPSRVD
jgi:sugar/nucleoside kinase (ribokinase family)